MKIAVDIDDTLNIVRRAEYADAYIKRHDLPFRIVDPHANEFVRVCNWTIDNVIACMHDGGIDAFNNAEVRCGAREALAGWHNDGHEIIILTARLASWFGDPESASRKWLDKNHLHYDSIVTSVLPPDKGAYCAAHGISVLVDDNIESCLGAQRAHVHAVLAVGRATAPRAHEIRYRGENWREIDAAVRGIISK